MVWFFDFGANIICTRKLPKTVRTNCLKQGIKCRKNGICWEFYLVPELVEGGKAKYSTRRPLRRRRSGEDWDIAFLIPFGRLRDRMRQWIIWENLLFNNAETSVNPLWKIFVDISPMGNNDTSYCLTVNPFKPKAIITDSQAVVNFESSQFFCLW